MHESRLEKQSQIIFDECRNKKNHRIVAASERREKREIGKNEKYNVVALEKLYQFTAIEVLTFQPKNSKVHRHTDPFAPSEYLC